MRAIWLVGLLLALNFSIYGQPAAAAAAQVASAGAAETFVQENIDKGYAILKDASLSESERHTQFRALLLGLIDSRRIGMFALGQYANGASKEDVDAFITAFSDYNEAIFESRLTKYKDHSLKVKSSVLRGPDDALVNCEVTDPADPAKKPYRVAFRVRKAGDGHFVVTDMSIEEIWQALTQRADVTAYLQQHGGHIAQLTSDLNRASSTVAVADNGQNNGPNPNGLRLDLQRNLFKPF